jgi:hypothetical protein
MVKKDKNISAMSTPAIGEAGLTGDWRDMKPVIDHSKCIPSVKKKAGLLFMLVVLSRRRNCYGDSRQNRYGLL